MNTPENMLRAINLFKGQQTEAVDADKGYNLAEIVSKIKTYMRWP